MRIRKRKVLSMFFLIALVFVTCMPKTFATSYPYLQPGIVSVSPEQGTQYDEGTITISIQGENCHHIAVHWNNSTWYQQDGNSFSQQVSATTPGTYSFYVAMRNTALDTDPGTLTYYETITFYVGVVTSGNSSISQVSSTITYYVWTYLQGYYNLANESTCYADAYCFYNDVQQGDPIFRTGFRSCDGSKNISDKGPGTYDMFGEHRGFWHGKSYPSYGDYVSYASYVN